MDTLQGIVLFGRSMVQVPTQLQNELDQLKAKLPSARLLIARSEWAMFKKKELDDLILQLKYATYDAEDLLRDFEDQALRQKIEGTDRSWGGQLISSSVNIAKHFILDISKRMRDTQDRLDNAMAVVEKELNLMGLHVEPVQAMPTTTEIITAPEVFGRDTERDQVMEMLGVAATIDRTEKINQVITQMGMPLTMGSTSSRTKRDKVAAAGHGAPSSTSKPAKRHKGNSSSSTRFTKITNFIVTNVSVLPIFGIGGIGKTTLAQLIYNDERVKAHFTVMIWVCVTDLFDDERMTKEILKEVANPDFDLTCDLISGLRAEMRKQLKRQRFLIVLDDMWEITQLQWETFYEPLRHGIEGSMILVTTRHENMARHVATNNCKPVQLEGLPDDTFWEFFKKCAFGEVRLESYPQLQFIGRSISSKLHGTPLAAKTLGRLLNSNLTEEHWMAINDSELWDQEQKQGDILPALRLSYLHLPYELRRCFAFCAMFPKDYSFERYEIVGIWVAEGFVASLGSKRLEDVGISYLDKLRGRCLFQTDPQFPDENRYKMHDLIHDVAQQASMHECILMKDSTTMVHKPLHMSVEVDAKSLSTRADIQHMNKLRSLRLIIKLDAEINWFSQLSNILFLSLKGCKLEKLPESICDLSSLRYLDISHSHVKELPAKFCRLYSLQVVDASSSRVKKIHQDVTKLINLRQLALPPKASMDLSRVPGLGNLSWLQNLKYFTHGIKNGGIGELKGMNQLRGTLCIRSIGRVKSKEEAAAARLCDKKHLKKLDLHWRIDPCSGRRLRPKDNEVFDSLCPNKRIECLKVHGFLGDRLPSWFNPKVLCNLRCLEFSNCPCLEILSTSQFAGVSQAGSTVQQASSSANCSNGTTCMSFTHLTAISIVRCHGLRTLDQFLSPKNMPYVKSILIYNCSSLESIAANNFVGFIHLQELTLNWCESLVCSQPSEEMVLPPSLRRLCIRGCGQLDRSFPSCLDKLTSLTVLFLGSCYNVRSILLDSIPKLRFLRLGSCPELSSICGPVFPSSIGYVLVNGCPKLTQNFNKNELQEHEKEEIKKFIG